MSTDTTTAKRTLCPSCKKPGKRVGLVTLHALLKPEKAAALGEPEPSACTDTGECRPPREDTGWRFCDAPGCEVVYFSETSDEQFTLDDLTVEVGVKQTTGERPLCYCFGHSVESIKAELREKGRSDALEDIRAKMESPGCHCATANPSGTCCLGSVARGIEIARAELAQQSGAGDAATQDPPAGGMLAAKAADAVSSRRGERIAKVGTLLSAVMASACCWLPLVLLALGVSGAGIAATLETYRPVFIVVTFAFLAAAFYFTYRPKKSLAGADACCGEEASTTPACCRPTSARRFTLPAMNKIMLWVVTAVAVAFLFFPSYVGALLGTGEKAPAGPNLNWAVFQIDGMTCEGCAAVVETAVRKVPGVVSVEVDYDQARATVGVEAGQPVPVDRIVATLQEAGYQATPLDQLAIGPCGSDGSSCLLSTNSPAAAETVFHVEGLSCEGCAALLTEALRSVPGVSGVRVDVESGQVVLQSLSCCTLSDEAVIAAIEKAGFHGRRETAVHPESTSTSVEGKRSARDSADESHGLAEGPSNPKGEEK